MTHDKAEAREGQLKRWTRLKQMSRVTGMDSTCPGQERALWFVFFFPPLLSHSCPSCSLVTGKDFFLGSVYHLLRTPTYTFTGRKVLLKFYSHHVMLLLTNPASIFLPESEPVFGITVVLRTHFTSFFIPVHAVPYPISFSRVHLFNWPSLASALS